MVAEDIDRRFRSAKEVHTELKTFLNRDKAQRVAVSDKLTLSPSQEPSALSNLSPVKPSPAQETVSRLSIEVAFVERCREALVRSIGPMGSMILTEVLEQAFDSPADLVAGIAKEIPDPQAAQAFQAEMLEPEESHRNFPRSSSLKRLVQTEITEAPVTDEGSDLNTLVTEMRGANGVEIKDRWQGLRRLRRCFVGAEAVDWLMAHKNLDREQARVVGRRLIDAKLAYHVDNTHSFRDDHLLYRFIADDEG